MSIEDKKLKHLTYLKALIVSDTTVFSDILTDISNTAGEEITDDEYKRLIEDRRRSAASSCEKTSNGLTAQIELEKRMLCFSAFRTTKAGVLMWTAKKRMCTM